MNINDMTIGQIKEITAMLGNQSTHQPFEIGKNYLIRTVTHIDVGTVIEVGSQELVMVDVSWIADTGRYHDALVKGTLNEVEPYPVGQKVIIGRGSIIDATLWVHPLPQEQR